VSSITYVNLHQPEKLVARSCNVTTRSLRSSM